MTSTSPAESPAIAEPTVPAFETFDDVHALLDRRQELRETLGELRATARRRLATIGNLEGKPNAWRAATSPARLGFGSGTAAVADDGSQGILDVRNLTELEDLYARAEDDLEQIADRLLTCIVIWADRYFPRPPSGFWTFTRTKGVPRLVTVELSQGTIEYLAKRFEWSPAGMVFDADQIRREYPEVAGELDKLLAQNKGRLWFAAVGKTAAAVPVLLDDPGDNEAEEPDDLDVDFDDDDLDCED